MSEPVETPLHECEFCQSTIDVEWQEDPYASEVYADDTPHWICAGCCDQSAADI